MGKQLEGIGEQPDRIGKTKQDGRTNYNQMDGEQTDRHGLKSEDICVLVLLLQLRSVVLHYNVTHEVQTYDFVL